MRTDLGPPFSHSLELIPRLYETSFASMGPTRENLSQAGPRGVGSLLSHNHFYRGDNRRHKLNGLSR